MLKPYSPAPGAAAPTLGTIDLCTGAVAVGPGLSLGGTRVRRAEGLAQDPATGTFHLSFGRMGTGAATEFLSENTGTVDVASGAVTLAGRHDTLQDDGDVLLFEAGNLKLLDVATASNNGALYALDKVTGAATAPVTTGPTVQRLAYDPTRGVVFSAVGTGSEGSATNRSIGTLDTATGTNTPLGPALPAGAFDNRKLTGLLSAPPPTCP